MAMVGLTSHRKMKIMMTARRPPNAAVRPVRDVILLTISPWSKNSWNIMPSGRISFTSTSPFFTALLTLSGLAPDCLLTISMIPSPPAIFEKDRLSDFWLETVAMSMSLTELPSAPMPTTVFSISFRFLYSPMLLTMNS